MYGRRLAANLRQQNWTAIAIDFVLLALGVFLGVIAANWNQQRLEDRQSRELLQQLASELNNYRRNLGELAQYYDVPARNGDLAIRAWNGDRAISDREFVIAAYQASQVIGASYEGMIMADMFGAGHLRTIKDVRVRQALAGFIGMDKTPLLMAAVSTPFRQNVRRVIPDEAQRRIRARCDDRSAGPYDIARLPERCDADIPPKLAKEAAAVLRAHPELKDDLQWHRAAVPTQIYNMHLLQDLIVEFERAAGGQLTRPALRRHGFAYAAARCIVASLVVSRARKRASAYSCSRNRTD